MLYLKRILLYCLSLAYFQDNCFSLQMENFNTLKNWTVIQQWLLDSQPTLTPINACSKNVNICCNLQYYKHGLPFPHGVRNMLYACVLHLTKEGFCHEKFDSCLKKILDYSSWNISVHIFCRFFYLQQFSSVWLISHCVRNIFINPFLASQNPFPFQWRLHCHLCLLSKILKIILWKFLCRTNWPVTYEENILLPWTSEICFPGEGE